MQKTYDVIVTRDITESCILTIASDSAADAQVIALVRSHTDSDVVWERDDNSDGSGDHYVTGCDDISETGA